MRFRDRRYNSRIMSLSAGTKLGPYEIQAPLGAGGMGEVYRARDTRLERTVAVKVLPDHLSCDPESSQRFEREARTISSLNHPHICALYDIGTQDGIDFLVMEYLEGQTLADRLQRGALPVEEVLEIGIEIADALDKAHRQGIVHRDLKPSNIMLKVGSEVDGFWLGQTGTGCVYCERECRHTNPLELAHCRRNHCRNIPIHGSRTVRGQRSRCAIGHFRLRCFALRDGDWPCSIHSKI